MKNMIFKGSKQKHDRIVKETLLILGQKANQLCRAFNNPTGVATIQRDWGQEFVHYGVKGSGDIYGFLKTGRMFFIEIKSGDAKQQKNQKSFEQMCSIWNVFYFVCRSAEEALTMIIHASGE